MEIPIMNLLDRQGFLDEGGNRNATNPGNSWEATESLITEDLVGFMRTRLI
jgi:hypothetical protein